MLIQNWIPAEAVKLQLEGSTAKASRIPNRIITPAAEMPAANQLLFSVNISQDVVFVINIISFGLTVGYRSGNLI